jgi:hypothetical protein
LKITPLFFTALLMVWTVLQAAAAPASVSGSTRASATNAVNRTQVLFDYYISKGLDTYIEKGRRNPKWNMAAEEALTLLAKINTEPGTVVSNTVLYFKHLDAAMDAGCTDPFIQYLALAAGPRGRYASSDAYLKACVQSAKGMDGVDYARPLKVLTQVFPWKQWDRVQRQDWSKTPPYKKEFAECFFAGYELAIQVIRDGRTPIELISDICQEMMGCLAGDRDRLREFHNTVQPLLRKTWPNSAYTWLIGARHYIRLGWLASIDGYEPRDPERLKLFKEAMTKAESSLNKAWTIDQAIEDIPVEMIKVQRALAKDRANMELWFARAMTINSNSQEACNAKLIYLTPRAHGTPQEMLAFARECVRSSNWGGQVPYTMIDAHERIASVQPFPARSSYWLQQKVWEDVKEACEKALLTYADDVNTARHYYIYNAWQCQQWRELMQQARLLTSTNVDHFGGAKAFHQMVSTAEERSKEK